MAETSLPPLKGFLPSSLIEWEGKVSCALFLPGCNFRCPFCHASSLVLAGQKTEAIPFEPIQRRLRANEGWLDGAVVSGGEPTLHKHLIDLILELRKLVPAIKLDTNGSNPHVVRDLLAEGLLDFVSMDVKAPLGEAYKRAAGVDVDCAAIAETIALLHDSGVGHEFRTTVVPGLHECADVVAIARHLGRGERLILQQFAPLNCLDPRLNEAKPYPRSVLRDMARAAGEFLAECRVRGERVREHAGQAGTGRATRNDTGSASGRTP